MYECQILASVTYVYTPDKPTSNIKHPKSSQPLNMVFQSHIVSRILHFDKPGFNIQCKKSTEKSASSPFLKHTYPQLEVEGASRIHLNQVAKLLSDRYKVVKLFLGIPNIYECSQTAALLIKHLCIA